MGVIGNAVLGSAATDTTSRWYRRLRKPSFQPPGWVFPVAWTALYADMAAVVGQSLADLQEQGRNAEYEDLKKALAANSPSTPGGRCCSSVAGGSHPSFHGRESRTRRMARAVRRVDRVCDGAHGHHQVSQPLGRPKR